MENNNNETFNDPLSDDSEENLRMENELLRLKLKAELGGDSHSSGNLDPALENEFLKQVMAFESNYANSNRAKVFDILGKPDFKRADELADDLIESALAEVLALLAEKSIEVDFIGTYDNRTKYAFITDELFDHEADDFKIPGMVTHFIYEEFHPNHKLDIENRVVEFLNAWFEQKPWISSAFSDEFVLPNKTTATKKEMAEKLKTIFDSYNAFTEYKYAIKDISFELKDEGGMGYAEGYASYKAILENNDEILIKGPFKLYMSCEYGWWSIFHIVFPGFEC